MKKQLSFLTARLFISSTIFLVAIGLNKAQAAADTSKAAQFSYVEAKEDAILFLVNYPNQQGKVFMLEVRDGSGEVLYKQAFEGENFNRKICIMKDKEKMTVRFTIRSAKTAYSETFEVSPDTRLVSDYIVKRL